MKSKCRVVEFEPAHLESLDLRDIFDGDESKMRILGVFGSGGCHIRTVLVDEVPAAILGVNQPRPGFAEVFSLTSDLVCKNPVAFHKAVYALILEADVRCGVYRMQMTVRKDYIMGQRWANALGFEVEALARNYGGPGVDHFIYVRIPKEAKRG